MVMTPQSEKPVEWYFDQQEDWAESVHSFKLHCSDVIGAKKVRSLAAYDSLGVDENHPVRDDVTHFITEISLPPPHHFRQ